MRRSVAVVSCMLVDIMRAGIAGVSGLVNYGGLPGSYIRKIPPHRSRIVWYRLVVGLRWGCVWRAQVPR